MSIQDRGTLKTFFETGDHPSQSNFEDLIDSIMLVNSWKQSVLSATTDNVVLSGNQTIDGVSLSDNDRVLVKDQADATENGIYIVATGVWVRASDNDTGIEIAHSMVFCERGSLNKGTQWHCTDSAVTLGSTNITFVKITEGSLYTNGAGISLSGNEFSIDDTVVTLDEAQSLTNKTLVSPKVSMGGDATGDLYYRDASGKLVRLPVGNSAQVLKGGSVPSYASIASILGFTPVNLNGDTMTGLLILSGSPSHALGAVTKSYVDNLIAGLTWKNSVLAATTDNITLSGHQTIDGISVVTHDRVLVKDQTEAIQNGIYVVASGTWSRASDNDTGAEIASTTVLCEGGIMNAATQWNCSNSSVVLGSTDIAFVQIAGAGVYTNGAGLSLTGNVFSVDDSVVTLTDAQSLTNKTLIGPKINIGADATGDLYYRDGSGNFVRLPVGTSSQVLKGGAIPSYSPVTETMQSLSDVTTNNVTASQHGYAPKLPNDATQYLDGTGNYTKPEGISLGKSIAISRNCFLL